MSDSIELIDLATGNIRQILSETEPTASLTHSTEHPIRGRLLHWLLPK